MKKIVSLGTISLIIVGMSVSQAFSDVSSKHWAKGAIDKMVEQNIISGYTDGTFQPSRNLSKIESLILLSKIAGINKYSDEATAFEKKYETVLSTYKTAYKKQVAYLLGTEVLKEEELPSLISADKLNTPITREEMAVLITKILGKEAEVKNKDFVILPFDDISKIETEYKPYVEYVYNESIMKGMNANKFSPKEYVTRAQAAVILNSIVGKVNIIPKQEIVDPTTANVTLTSGKITDIDTVLKTIEIDDEDIFEYDDDTEVYMKKTLATVEDIALNMEISKVKIKEGIIEEITFDIELKDGEDDKKEEIKQENEKENDEGYIIGEVEEATSKKVIITLVDGESVTLYPEDEYKAIDAEDGEEIKLKRLKEGDRVIVTGEYEEDDYYFTVLVKLAK